MSKAVKDYYSIIFIILIILLSLFDVFDNTIEILSQKIPISIIKIIGISKRSIDLNQASLGDLLCFTLLLFFIIIIFIITLMPNIFLILANLRHIQQKIVELIKLRRVRRFIARTRYRVRQRRKMRRL